MCSVPCTVHDALCDVPFREHCLGDACIGWCILSVHINSSAPNLLCRVLNAVYRDAFGHIHLQSLWGRGSFWKVF